MKSKLGQKSCGIFDIIQWSIKLGSEEKVDLIICPFTHKLCTIHGLLVDSHRCSCYQFVYCQLHIDLMKSNNYSLLYFILFFYICEPTNELI